MKKNFSISFFFFLWTTTILCADPLTPKRQKNVLDDFSFLQSLSHLKEEPAAAPPSLSPVEKSQSLDPNAILPAEEETSNPFLDEEERPSLSPASFRTYPLPADSGVPPLLPLFEPTIAQETETTPERGESTRLFEEERRRSLEEQEERRRREEEEAPGITGSFTNVSVIEFINFLGNALGKNFVYDEKDLQFTITVISSEEESLDNLLALLLQQLQVHNLSLIEQGNTLLIHPNPEIRSPGEIVVQGEGRRVDAEIVTQVFPLNTLDPTKVSDIIRPLLSTEATVLVLRDSNNIVITDLKVNVDRVADLIVNLDSPIGGMDIGQYVSENSLALSLVGSAEQILQPIAQGNPFFLVPHEATNSVFIISNPFLVERAIKIMSFLDTSEGRTRLIQLEELRRERVAPPVREEEFDEEAAAREAEAQRRAEEERRRRLLEQGWRIGPNGELIPPGVALSPQARATAGLPEQHIARTFFFIYKLKYRSGDQIVQALKQIAGTLTFAGNVNKDLISAINSIQWIESTNSLIFTGTATALERIKELVEEIDIPLRQVFLEILILDTTINDSLTYAVDWGSRYGGGDWAGGQSFLRAGSVLPNALATAGIGLTPDASSLATSSGYNLGIIGQNITKMGMRFNSVGALVTAIHEDQFSEMVMNPKIITEDNHTAELFVGREDRFRTQTISNEQNQLLTSNFETVDVGTTLKITPLLGNSDIITLEIEEETTNEAPTANQQQNQTETDIFLLPVATKNTTMTRVHVPNKYFVVLSGMTRDQQQRSENRVPCLGGFPIIGTVFRQKNNRDVVRNLMIFIRPEIVDTDEDYRRITQRNQDIFKEKDKIIRRWTLEYDEALEWANLKKTTPNESCAPYKPADCPEYCPTK